jgi:hypothetical protein
MPQSRITTEMRRCIENCVECHAICVETISHCLGIGGRHASEDHIGLLEDCSQICQTSADFMLRGSERHRETCRVCADICVQCAQDCDRLAGRDATMTRCAETCRRCAESCMAMAGEPVV